MSDATLVAAADTAAADPDADAAFFTARTYRSKDDVVAAVAEYHLVRRRAFKVLTSDRRRFQARCTDAACAFVVRFAFSSAFKPPSLFQPHSCAAPPAPLEPLADATLSSTSAPAAEVTAPASLAESAARVSSLACRAKQIARYPEIRALALAHGEKLKPAWIHDELARSGLRPSYANCFHARKRLLAELAADPRKFAESAGLLSLAALSGGGSASLPASPAKRVAVPSALAVAFAAELSTFPGTAVTPAAPRASTAAAADAAGKENTATTACTQELNVSRAAAEDSPRKRLKRDEPEGCCFICPPTRVPAAERHQILQWQVRERASAAKAFFDLYDDNRRIEIRTSGTYRLHLYFEPPPPESAARDAAKLFLMVNNQPLSVFKDEMGGGAHQARDDVPVGVFNTAEVPLRKWDMLVLRRTRGERDSDSDAAAVPAPATAHDSAAEARTLFGRFILELVA